MIHVARIRPHTERTGSASNLGSRRNLGTQFGALRSSPSYTGCPVQAPGHFFEISRSHVPISLAGAIVPEPVAQLTRGPRGLE